MKAEINSMDSTMDAMAIRMRCLELAVEADVADLLELAADFEDFVWGRSRPMTEADRLHADALRDIRDSLKAGNADATAA